MKFLLFFLLSFSHLGLVAQNKPSQAEINKMMKEAQAQMKELEKDPEVGEMMRKINAAQKSSVQTAVIRSPVSTFVDFSKVKIPTTAEARDKLYGFKGKKVNDSILVTPHGFAVKYSKKSSRLIIQPPSKSKSIFNSIQSEFMKTEKRKDDFVDLMVKEKNGHYSYPFVKQGLDAIDEIQNETAAFLKNTIQLPVLPDREIQEDKQKGSGRNEETAAIPEWVVRNHAEVMAYKKSHENDSWFYIPPPPIRNFDFCNECDSAGKRAFNKAKADYHIEFSKHEAEMSRKALQVMRYYEENKTVKEAESLATDMMNASQWLADYISRKADELLKKYGKDVNRLATVVNVVLSIERQKQLLKMDDQSGNEIMLKIAPYLEVFDKQIDQLIEEKDYNQLLNFNWVIGIERQRQLLGMPEALEKLVTMVHKLMNFNRFKLTAESDTKYIIARDEEKNIEYYVRASFEGENYFSMIPDKDCILRLFTNDITTFKGDGMSTKQAFQATSFLLDLKKVESNHGSFISPFKWVTLQPFLRMSFCAGTDTMLFIPFGPHTPYEQVTTGKAIEEKWNIPDVGVTTDNRISNAISNSFVTHEPHSDDLEGVDESDITAMVSAGVGGTKEVLSTLKMKHNVMNLETRMMSAQNRSAIYVINKMKNRSRIVFEGKVDGKEGNDNSADIVFSWLKVQVEHDPFPDN